MGSEVRVTWWGHSTIWLEDSGVRLVTDPVLRDRVAHLRRRRGPTPRLSGPPDAVLVSHLHADHLDLATLRNIPLTATLVVPAGAGPFLRRRLGADTTRRTVELAPGESTRVGAVTVRAVPAVHDGGRGPWSRHRAVAVGYTMHGAANIWYPGDTGLFEGMSTLGPLDLALVPVGGWGPTLGAGHLDPAQAAEAVRRSAPRHAVPVHFGTFWPAGLPLRRGMFHDPGARFAARAAEVAPATRVTELPPGGTLALDHVR
ncbi:MBL fold metallo-hydrolase [Micromonospora sp. HM5-17]|uniref:MBL fold metallo-hydrolase n=1 Tax=Micromonospora sp. HM5-17 TaxID=2487710 RepID=UPI000F46857C|nr:MBL fold metallo-hydrolase [Micromonospora sp. HM5-17]ROT29823.1 MBL fold metallo-hydrolase [Micromonospora sp. HM5-17]